MSLKTMIIGTTAAVALSLGGLAVAGPAMATPTASTTAAPKTATIDQGAKGQHLRRRVAIVVVSAKTIGITPKDLVSQLKAGKSIAAVATVHGVDPQKVVNALVTAGDTRIDGALAANKITTDHANQLKTQLPQRVQKAVNAHYSS